MKRIIFAATITGALFMANFANAQKEAKTAAPKQHKEPAKTEKSAAKSNADMKTAKPENGKAAKPAMAKKEAKAAKPAAEKKEAKAAKPAMEKK